MQLQKGTDQNKSCHQKVSCELFLHSFGQIEYKEFTIVLRTDAWEAITHYKQDSRRRNTIGNADGPVGIEKDHDKLPKMQQQEKSYKLRHIEMRKHLYFSLQNQFK